MPKSKFSESALLAAFKKAGGTEEQFLRLGSESLNQTEETQLTTAGVATAGILAFLQRAKGILGVISFGALLGDYRDRITSQKQQGREYPGRKVTNPTGNLVKLLLHHVAKIPAGRITAGQGSAEDFISERLVRFDTTSASMISVSEPEISDDSDIIVSPLNSERRQKKLLQRIELSNAIQRSSALDRDRMAFASGALVQANLPHTDPGPIDIWERRNGDFSFILQPGTTHENGKRVRLGCPYGMFPRLTLLHLISQVKKTGERKIKLADSFYDFLRTIGVSDSKQNYINAREQLIRLLSANLSSHFQARLREPSKNFRDGGVSRMVHTPIAKDFVLWWAAPSDRDQAELFESFVLLDQDFYESIVGSPEKRGHAFPLDLDTIAAIKRSSLQLDVYQWAVYRIHRMMREKKSEICVSWADLHEQFGADYKVLRQFKAKLTMGVANIASYWRGGLNWESTPEGLVLKQSPLPVDPYSKKLMG